MVRPMVAVTPVVEVEIPTLPNFLKTTDGRVCDVANLDERALRAIGGRWVEELIKHAAARRARPANTRSQYGRVSEA